MEELDDTTEDNKADIHFGGTVLRKGYPGPLNIQTGIRTCIAIYMTDKLSKCDAFFAVSFITPPS